MYAARLVVLDCLSRPLPQLPFRRRAGVGRLTAAPRPVGHECEIAGTCVSRAHLTKIVTTLVRGGIRTKADAVAWVKARMGNEG